MTKPTIIFCLVLLALLGAGTLFYVLYEQQRAVSDPTEVISRFYTDWLAYPTNPLADRRYRNNPLLSKTFSDKIDSIVSNFDTGGFDPILCAQMKPKDYSITLLDRDDDSASFSVDEVFDGDAKSLTVYLKKTEKKWQIDDVNCNDISRATSSSSPALVSGLSNEAGRLVNDYIRENISTLSPEPAVLGGNFYVTEIIFQSPEKAVVTYEDGHISLTAEAIFSIEEMEQVVVKSFKIIKP